MLNVSYPMLFELCHPRTGKKTHCGVLEFVADEVQSGSGCLFCLFGFFLLFFFFSLSLSFLSFTHHLFPLSSTPKGSCFIPYWMMQNLQIKEGALLGVKNVTLPLGTVRYSCSD